MLRYNPTGFAGGGSDDQRYLDFANRWWAGDVGPGDTHWDLRHPLILSILAAFRLFGHSIASMLIVPAFYASALAGLSTGMIARHFDERTTLLWLALFVCSPVMHEMGTSVFPEMLELSFGVASLWLVWEALERPAWRAGKLIAAGGFAGLAFLTRETAAALIIVYGLAFLVRPKIPRAQWMWLWAGFLPVIAADVTWLWSETGDWLYRWHIGSRHVTIASEHMIGKVYHGGGPILNFDLASRWVPSGPVSVHWTVDPLINLILDPAYALIFVGWAAFALPLFRRRDIAAGGYARARPALIAVAVVSFVMVTWVLMLRPQPRYYLFATYAATVAVALLGMVALRRAETRRAAKWLIGLLIVAGLVVITFQADRNRPTEVVAPYLAAHPGSYHIDAKTAEKLRSPLAERGIRARLTGGEPPVGGLRLRILTPKPFKLWRPIKEEPGYVAVATTYEQRPIVHRLMQSPLVAERPALRVERRVR